MAQINLNLPSLTYPMGGENYIRLFNGVMIDHKGPFLGATLSQRIENGDFNNDTYEDAVVLLDVIYDYGNGVNATGTNVFLILQDIASGPKVTGYYSLAKSPTAKVDIFSANFDVNKLIIEYRQTRLNAYNMPVV
jgi:hypothetical protein